MSLIGKTIEFTHPHKGDTIASGKIIDKVRSVKTCIDTTVLSGGGRADIRVYKSVDKYLVQVSDGLLQILPTAIKKFI